MNENTAERDGSSTTVPPANAKAAKEGAPSSAAPRAAVGGNSTPELDEGLNALGKVIGDLTKHNESAKRVELELLVGELDDILFRLRRLRPTE